MATAANPEKSGDKVVKEADKAPELKEVQDEKKEATTEEEKKKPLDLAILKFVMKYVKFVGAALLIWFMGWMGFSYVWVAIALFLGVLWKMNKEDKKKKMAGFKKATENEQEAIIARMEDLPSWVRLILNLYMWRFYSIHFTCMRYNFLELYVMNIINKPVLELKQS